MKVVVGVEGIELVLLPLLEVVQPRAQIAHMLFAQHAERLAHVAQFQLFADVEHLQNGALAVVRGGEQHVLEDEIQAEGTHRRAPPRTGGDDAHQLHGLDGLAQHIAADPELFAKLLFRGDQVSGLQIVAQYVVAQLPEDADIEFLIALLCHSIPFRPGLETARRPGA